MTDKERVYQGLDFSYRNLALSTNHQPARSVFKKLAKELGLTDTEFEEWATNKQWRDQ